VKADTQDVKKEYRGADKSLARPERKQSTATEDFDVHISYLLSQLEEYYYYIYNKTSNKRNILIIKKIHREGGRAKDLAAPLYFCLLLKVTKTQQQIWGKARDVHVLVYTIFTSLAHSKRRWGQVFQVRRRGAAAGARVAALSTKRLFFYRYPCTSEALKHLYGTQWRLSRKMMSLFTFCVQ
jgi:hypothetical protein